jgi:hypothetical protein
VPEGLLAYLKRLSAERCERRHKLAPDHRMYLRNQTRLPKITLASIGLAIRQRGGNLEDWKLISNANRNFAHHTPSEPFASLVLGHYLRKPFTIKEHGARETNGCMSEVVTKVAEKGGLDSQDCLSASAAHRKRDHATLHRFITRKFPESASRRGTLMQANLSPRSTS